MSVLPPAIARRTDLASGVAFCGMVAAAPSLVPGFIVAFIAMVAARFCWE